ncbi:MAG: hypothetical protein CFE40_01660 [Burkholderiales bacterium PBB1]|nr:MAG: hypothetical protein CFE40_01660 [Burkholderiales bacterium PBB1]
MRERQLIGGELRGTVSDAALVQPQLAWWSKSEDLRLASVRMRAGLLMPMLAQRGIASAWFKAQDASRYRCVVVSKRYDDDTVSQLRRFKRHGGRLVLDLCDNDFLPRSQQEQHLHHVENLRLLATLADAIVTSSEPLARVVARECPTASTAVVISEMPDDPSIVGTSLWDSAWSRWAIAREQAHLNRVAPAGVARLLWFGNANKRDQQNWGMGELARIVPMLVDLNRVFPLHLTVISNNARRFREDVAVLMPSSRYIRWRPSTVEAILRMQHIALIPAQPNEFTACKSDNRVVTALRAGLAVVADPVPSYAPYAEVIQLGEMEAGLRRYLSDPHRRSVDASRGQALVAQSGYADRVLTKWLDVLAL